MTHEQQYTSTSCKLYNHLNTLHSIRDFKKWYPICLQIAPTELCNLNCKFCSVKNRGNKVLPFNAIMKTLNIMNGLKLQSIEITGGGDPTLYPQINELIELTHDTYDLKVGLITNGIKLDNIKSRNIRKLSWLRISLNGLDEGIMPKIPESVRCVLGFSYVWSKESTPDKLLEVYNLAKKYNVKYVRIVPDCLHIKHQSILKKEVSYLIKKMKMGDKLFVQTKNYEVYSKCYMGGLKPFLYTDGYIYQCSAVALYGRKFDPKWRICHMSEINKIWPNNYKGINNEMCKKGKCFYYDQNKLLDEVQMKVKHCEFI